MIVGRLEVLPILCGRSPAIIEIKTERRNYRELCRLLCRQLESYRGLFCLESFDPRIVFWFRLHAPEVLRGQLASRYSSMRKSTNAPQAFLLSRCMLNFLARPHFIAYEIGRKPLLVRLSELLGAMKVAWTSLEWKNEEGNDAVIFQFYRPRVKFK